MGTPTFSTLQVTSQSDKVGMDKLEALAIILGLDTSSVISLPINGWYVLYFYPSGSKAFWPDEESHQKKLKTIMDAVQKHNKEMGGNFLHALHTCVQENDLTGTFESSIVQYVGNDKFEN